MVSQNWLLDGLDFTLFGVVQETPTSYPSKKIHRYFARFSLEAVDPSLPILPNIGCVTVAASRENRIKIATSLF